MLRLAIYTKPQQSNKYWFCISSVFSWPWYSLYCIWSISKISSILSLVGWLDLIWNLGNPTARRSDTYCQWKAILKSLLKLKNFNFVQKILSRKLQTFQNTMTYINLFWTGFIRGAWLRFSLISKSAPHIWFVDA